MPIYCGRNAVPPAGKVRGTSNQCFLQGRKAGFVGGISKNNITKREVMAMGNAIHQRPLQAIAKALGIHEYALKKTQLLPIVVAHNWTYVNAKQVLLNL